MSRVTWDFFRRKSIPAVNNKNTYHVVMVTNGTTHQYNTIHSPFFWRKEFLPCIDCYKWNNSQVLYRTHQKHNNKVKVTYRPDPFQTNIKRMSSRAVLHCFPTSSDRGITCIPGFSLDTQRRDVPANLSLNIRVWSYTSTTSSSFSKLDSGNTNSPPQLGVQLRLWTVFWILPPCIMSCLKTRGTKISYIWCHQQSHQI